MQETIINCRFCGGEIKIKYRYTQMLVCPYCGQANLLNSERMMQNTGKIVLSDYGSILAVGKTGKIEGQNFYVLGRVRYDYKDGFWDEWLIALNDDYEHGYWLQEDEGDFVLFTPDDTIKQIPDFNNFLVATYVDISGKKLFITEKSKAVINGSEGEIPFAVFPNEKADFVDAIIYGEGKPVSIEYMPEGAVFYTGKEIDINQIVLNKY